MHLFTETRTPYEFLVRWDKDGKISGAHVAFCDTVKKDGEVIQQTPCAVQAVAVGTQAGFPLAEILDQLHIDALVSRETAIAERDAAKTEIDEIKAKRDTAIAANAAPTEAP